ncbi:MAG: hypothetical protein HY714_00935 [Candidatus Omnitrophica bacterium]|nr:hypothetical protein [Candidatus Omnitrophota bacterium]
MIWFTNKHVTAAVAFVFLAAGCTTTKDILSDRGRGGDVFVVMSSYPKVFEAAVETVERKDLKIIRKDKDVGAVVASDTIRFFNGGGRVAIYFQELSPSKTQVEIHSEPFIRLPSPTVYWAARKRSAELQSGIRALLA